MSNIKKHATALVTISNEDLDKVKITKEKIDKKVVWNWPVSKAGKEFLGIL